MNSNRQSQITRCNALIASGDLHLGMSRDEVTALLGKPDDTGCISRTGVPGIHKYGQIEFHFGKHAKDGLYLICADENESDAFVTLLTEVRP